MSSKEKEILGLSKQPDIYERLTNSIIPFIYGNSYIKESILLLNKLASDGA